MHRLVWFAPIVLLLAACGGGGGEPAPTPLPTPTRTPKPVPAETLYVRAGGSDANDGLTPATALRQVATAAGRTAPGSMIIAGPGVYSPVNITAEGAAAQPITFLADPLGQMTGDPPGEVLLDAAGAEAAFKISNKSHIVVDGFTATGAAAGSGTAGISIKSNATDVTVRNCIVRDNRGAGIRTADASTITIANNLVILNAGIGIQVLGLIGASQPESINVEVFNNTIFGNGAGGISVGSGTRPARDTTFANNITDANSGVGFEVSTGPPSSLDGLVERFNLNTDGYSVGVTPSPQSFSADPQFIAPGSNFRLAQPPDQPVTSPAVDAGDPDTPALVVAIARDRTTATSGSLDSGRLDLGYHYPR